MGDSYNIPAALLGSGIRFLISAISYYKYRQSKETLKQIEISHFKPDYYLWIDVQKNKRLYAAVEGKVELVGQPLKTNIVTTRGQQVFTVPFCLVPQNTDMRSVHLHVESPLRAEGDYLQDVLRGAQQFNKHGSTSADHQNVQEKMNAVVTGIGEVVMSQRCGGMVLQPPEDGQKFFLFCGGYDSVKKRFERKRQLLMQASILWAMSGCSIFGLMICTKFNTEKKRN